MKKALSFILVFSMFIGMFSAFTVIKASAESDKTSSGIEIIQEDLPLDAALPEIVIYLVHGEDTDADATLSLGGFEKIDRTAFASTSDIVTTVNASSTGKTTPIAPVYDVIDGVKEDKGGMFDYQFNSGATSKYAKPSTWTNMPESTDVRYVGTGEHSKYYVAVAYVVYEKNVDGSTKVDENGNYVIKQLRRYDDVNSPSLTIDGKETTQLPDGVSLVPMYDNYGGSRPFMFMMMDRLGQKYYGYCCDLNTPTNDGYYYTMANIEDSDYYGSETSEAHIRSIVMNGYWGTTDIPQADGTYAFGSLSLLKQKLIAHLDAHPELNTSLTAPVLDRNNKYKPVVDENGNTVMATKTMKEMVEGLTSGEALLATQAAIWTYANGSYAVLNGKDESIVLDPDGYKWNHDAMGNSKTAGGYTNGEAMDDFASTAVDFLYTWLINLDTKEESTVIINENNFVENLALAIGNKLVDTDGNDTYLVDLSFELGFELNAKDDLSIELTYGNTVLTKKLAGAGADIAIKNGRYVIEDLELTENEVNDLTLRLVGKQYLEQGAYVYLAHGGREKSQNFVGVAEGEKLVDVSRSISFSYEVEDKKITTIPMSAVIVGNKIMEGRSLREGEFEFVLKENGEAIAYAKNDKNGSFGFALRYEEPGVYHYTVEEVKGDDEKIVYDESVFDVTVIMSADGMATIEYENDVVFRNSTVAPALATINGYKYLDGELADGFTFVLEDDMGNIVDTATSMDGEFEFNLELDEAYTHVYYVYELDENEEGIVYDDSVFEVRIDVERADTAYTATVRLMGVSEIAFYNETEIPEETTEIPEETTEVPEETTEIPEETTEIPEETTEVPEETTEVPEETTEAPEETTEVPEETTEAPEVTTEPEEEITEEPTPLDPTPETTEPEEEITDPEIPLDPNPKTGDSAIILVIAAIAVLALAALYIKRRQVIED